MILLKTRSPGVKTPRRSSILALFLALSLSSCALLHAAEPLEVVFAISDDSRDGGFKKLREHLEKHHDASVTVVFGASVGKEHDKSGKVVAFRDEKRQPFDSRIPPFEDCDVILTNLYRTAAPPEQLAAIKQAFLSKPVVGMRRAHHGFQNWLGADMEVFGVDYRGHKKGERHRVAADHPLLAGLVAQTGSSEAPEPDGGYYGHERIAADVLPLLVMTPPSKGNASKKNETTEVPQTWLRVSKNTGQRVVYTRYGPASLDHGGVRDLVVRSLFWAAGRDAPRTSTAAPSYETDLGSRLIELRFSLADKSRGKEKVTVRLMEHDPHITQSFLVPGDHPYKTEGYLLEATKDGWKGHIYLSTALRGGPARGMGTPRIDCSLDVELKRNTAR